MLTILHAVVLRFAIGYICHVINGRMESEFPRIFQRLRVAEETGVCLIKYNSTVNLARGRKLFWRFCIIILFVTLSNKIQLSWKNTYMVPKVKYKHIYSALYTDT